MEEQSKNLQDYLIAIHKRKAAIISIVAVIFIFTVVIAFILPPKYKSSSTILIEQQEIPKELVMSTVTSFAAERIQSIQARVMTRTNLLEIIDKFDLYKDERKVVTTEELIATMQEDVGLEVISADIVDPRTGRPSSVTIAFNLSFVGEYPEKVQKVTNELTTLYLSENITSRTQEAQDASDFFKAETDRLGNTISELEAKLAAFKQEHASALPELQLLNIQTLQRQESELAALDAKLSSLNERGYQLKGQLAQMNPGSSAVPGAAERLQALEAEYASAKARYSDEHPDVVRLRNEIEALKTSAGGADSSAAIAEALVGLRAELAEKQQKYTDDHPDVVSLKEKIASLSKDLEEAKDAPKAEEEYFESTPDNPAYISLSSQLEAVNSEIKSIALQKAKIAEKVNELEKVLLEAPQVEKDFLALKRDYDNAVRRYQDTQSKQMHADIAKQLESESKGERFVLIDPAALPEEPISPNRPAIVFLGLILALGSGFGFAVVADAISGTVRSAKGLEMLLGIAPLAVIPYEMNLKDVTKHKRIRKRIILLFIMVIVLALLFVHFVITPLDVLWYRGLRKLDVLML